MGWEDVMARARCEMLVKASAEAIFDGFVQPAQLTRYWLSAATAPLTVGAPVEWDFLVPGARTTTTAWQMQRPDLLAFDWPDGVTVGITIRRFDEASERVTILVDSADEARLPQLVEGFTLVLADLKLLLETGTSPGLVRARAALMSA